MEVHFSQLVEVPLLQHLMEKLWEASGLPVGILDLEGNILVATGWQPICTEFHRRTEKSLERCRESDAFIHAHLASGEGPSTEEPIEYLCRNGLVDTAMPIMIDGRHLATLFLGQFFYEKPDEGAFRRQAKEFGFEEEPYLEALARVPIFSRERVLAILAFYRLLVQFLGQCGSEKLQRLQVQEKLFAREWRLRKQNQELRHISSMRGVLSSTPEQIVPFILEIATRTLEVSRTVFWRFTGGAEALECADLNSAVFAEERREEPLRAADYPDFFLSLEGASNIAADRALTDPRTRELVDRYLEPRGVTSLLCSPVWLEGRMIGILSCEHAGEPRRWSFDEQNFIASMADQISQSLEADERRLAEKALRESEEKYRLLFDYDSDAVLFFDAETLEIEEVNKAAAVLYGRSRDDFSGCRLVDISAEPQKTREEIAQLRGKGMTRFEVLHRKRDGSVFPAEVAHGFFDWKGRRMGVGVVRDVSERREMMRLKDEMLSAVSHEIRTPLTAILGFAEFLRSNRGSEVPVEEYLDIILREGERLRDLTDNLLDLQRLRAGFGRKTFRLLEVSPLIASVSQLFERIPGGHRLVLSRQENLPTVWGDERQLYRALQNLLSNAFKYSPQGSTVELGVDSEGDFLTFWVRDEGEGIPAEYREEVFDRFFRLDNQGGEIGGTGLGLALVKAIAEVHQGQVWVESEPGRGSKFILSIPFSRPSE